MKKEKKLPISKRSILIASILVLAIGLPVAYFLWSNAQEDAAAWYNSSWLYRRSISVANPGGTLTNEDVLIEYDTSTLITGSKLQSDCDDLRFVDSDDSTLLAYWVEGGCNTTDTQIWVRIPSLPSGGKTIYMYYGNDTATNAEETWAGKFYLMKNSACDSGWTTESGSGGDFNLKFPYPSASFGTTGGSSSHDHGNTSLTSGTYVGAVTNITNSTGNTIPSLTHTHSVSVPIQTNSNVLPPYLDMIFCSNSDLIVKQNTVTVFAASVPSGFTQFSALDNKFPRGNSSYGGSGIATTHTHTTTQVTSGASSTTDVCMAGSDSFPSGAHTHTFASSTTGTGNQIPEYMTVVYGQANADIAAPSATIVMSNATPPLGWTRYSALDSKFPYGSTSYGTTGGNPTHTHSVSVTSGNDSGSVSCEVKSQPKVSWLTTHTHTASGTTSTYSNNPPYISTLFVQKKTSQSVTVNNEQTGNVAPDAPSSLLTEGATNPTGVSDTTPEFSAVFTDSNSEDTGNYYEIEVNTASDFTGTVMWDSGQLSTGPITNGARSSDISYDGLTISKDGSTYYWRIRFWDNSNTVSDWSATANFTMVVNTAPNAPSSLLAEGATNPPNVTDQTPEFSAIFTDTDSSDTGTAYEIEINTNNTFTGTVIWDTDKVSTGPITNGARSSDFAYDQTPLALDGTTYYWRIRFWDGSDAVSNWSSTAQFTMSGPPNAPSSLLTEGATNPTGVTDTTPEFSAVFTDPNTSDTGNQYQIQVNTQSDFLGTSMWDSTQLATGPITNGARSADFSYAGTTLTKNGTTYYWRIKFWDAAGNPSDWSSTAQFTMYNNVAPNAPSSLLAEGATNPDNVSDTTPEFSAVFSDSDSGDTGLYYEIEINTNNTFTGTVIWDTNKVSTGPITNGARSSDFAYNDTPLALDGTTYYWRIRFWDDSDAVSNWSSTANFKMAVAPNAPTSLLTEGATNPASVLDTTPEFSAVFTDGNTSDTGTYYQIQVNTQSDFLGTSMWDSTQLATGPITNGARSSDFSYAGLPLSQDATTYYWRIKFWDSTDLSSNWSATAQFTMAGAPYAPSALHTETLTNPTKVTDTKPEFSAVFSDPNGTDTGNYYQIQVNTQSDFLGTSMWDSTQTATGPITNGTRSSEIEYAPTALALDGTTYYWRIKFWDNTNLEGSWSSTAQFTMSGPPAAPTSLLAEGATNPTGVTDTTPEFSAIYDDPNSDNSAYYQIQVNTQSDFLGTSMWDSGQQAITITDGSRSSDIAYNGTTLTRNGATYYWRIKFWDTDSNEGSWSSTAQFTMYTNSAPNAPSSLLAEGTTNPTKVTDTTPEFSAIFTDTDGTDTGIYYEIEVNTNNTFTGTVMWDSGQQATGPITNGNRSSDIQYGESPLALDGTTYYWRIRFWDDSSAVSNWSSTAQFTMSGPPSTPTSLLTEGATNPTGVTDVTPEFSAIYDDPNGDSSAHYEIEVNTNSSFTGTVMWDSNQQAITITDGARSANISYNGTTLTKNGVTYYWRIRFWDTDTNVSNWSSTAQFTMYANNAPNAPTSLLAEGTTNPDNVLDTTPEFSAIYSDADATDTALYYEIEVNTNNTFTGTVMWDSNKTSITAITNGQRSPDIVYQPTNLTLDGTIYYWRIRFWDDSDAVSNWSSVAQFKMSGPPDAPSAPQTEGLTNPSGITDLTPEFSVVYTDTNTGDTATSYEIEVNSNSSFTGTVMWDSNKVSMTPVANGNRTAEISYAGIGLTRNGTTYYWRSRLWDANENVSDWSTTASFTMYSNNAPNTPTSLYTESTTNPIKVTDTTPEFSAVFSDVDAGDTGSAYEIEVNTASDFTGTVMWDSDKVATGPITNGSRSSEISYGQTALALDGTKYYWRIRFWDDTDAVSNWSSIANFTMSGPPSTPTSPLVDGMNNPAQILSLNPKFSALHTDVNNDNAVYYEVEVNSNNTFTGTVMWDSGKIAMTSTPSGSYTPDIAYDGTALTGDSSITYYWRIRLWDTDDNVSDWSATSSFVDYKIEFMKFDGVNMEGVKIN